MLTQIPYLVHQLVKVFQDVFVSEMESEQNHTHLPD